MSWRRTRLVGKMTCCIVVLVLAAPQALALSTSPEIPIYPGSKEEAPFALTQGPEYRVIGRAVAGTIVSARVESDESGGVTIDWDEPVISEGGKKVTMDGHVRPNAVVVAADRVWMAAVFKGELSMEAIGPIGPPLPALWEIDTMKTALTIDIFNAVLRLRDMRLVVEYYAKGVLGKPGGELKGSSRAPGVVDSDWAIPLVGTPWEKDWQVGLTVGPVGPGAGLVVRYEPPSPYKTATVGVVVLILEDIPPV